MFVVMYCVMKGLKDARFFFGFGFAPNSRAMSLQKKKNSMGLDFTTTYRKDTHETGDRSMREYIHNA